LVGAILNSFPGIAFGHILAGFGLFGFGLSTFAYRVAGRIVKSKGIISK
jgi:hypothetical protein